MTSNLFTDQITMLRAFRQTTGEINTTQASLYLKLMLEEMGETLCAANPAEKASITALISILGKFAEVSMSVVNVVEVFDGLLDVLVVTINAGHSFNFPMQEGWDEVLRSNMAKVDPTTGQVILREDGKVLKPSGWTPPDLLSVLNKEPNKEPNVGDIVPTAEAFAQPRSNLLISDRYLNLALQELGSCLTTIGNLRQRDAVVGDAYTEVCLGLTRVISALQGKTWIPPVDAKERWELTRLKDIARHITSLQPKDLPIPVLEHALADEYNRTLSMFQAMFRDLLKDL